VFSATIAGDTVGDMKRHIAAIFLMGALMTGAAPAYAEIALPLTQAAHIVDDPATARVFISSGQAGDAGLVVANEDGSGLATLPDEAGADGMVVDGATLYVMRCNAGQIDVIDTASLTRTGSIPVPGASGACDLGFTTGRLWFQDANGALDSVTTAAPHTIHVTTTGSVDELMFAQPPAGGGSTLAVGVSGSPSTVWAYDASAADPAQTGTESIQELADFAITPDSSSVAVAWNGTYTVQLLGLPDLTSVAQTYDVGAYPVALAYSRDGTRLFASSMMGVRMYDTADATTPLWQVSLDGFDTVGRTLTFGHDGAEEIAVARDVVGSGGLQLFAFDGLGREIDTPAASDLSANAGWDYGVVGTPLTIGGGLTFRPGALASGVTLSVVRSTTGLPDVALPDVVTAADGSYSFQDTPTRRGAVAYHVSYAGDAWHTQAHADVSLTIYGLTPKVSLDPLPPNGSQPTLVQYGTRVTLVAHLDSPTANHELTLTATSIGYPLWTITIGTETVDAAGVARFTFIPVHDADYQVSFSGDGGYAPGASDSVRIDVQAVYSVKVLGAARHTGHTWFVHYRSSCAKTGKHCPGFAVTVHPASTEKKEPLGIELRYTVGRRKFDLRGELVPVTLANELDYGARVIYRKLGVGASVRVRFSITDVGQNMGFTTAWYTLKLIR
jgi:hypothetical protein